MKNASFLVTLLGMIVLMSFQPAPKKTSNLIFENNTSATVSRIQYDDDLANSTVVNNPNPSTFSVSIADQNEIYVKISGTYSEVAVRTADGTTTIGHYSFTSTSVTTFYFNVNLTAGNYKVVVD